MEKFLGAEALLSDITSNNTGYSYCLFNNVKTWCISFILQTQCIMFAGFLSVTGGGVVGSLRISDFCIANSFIVLHFSSDMLWFVFSLISDENSYTMVEYFNFIIRFLYFDPMFLILCERKCPV